MSGPADVDKMVSSFLSELNTLSDSLGLTQDKAAVDLTALNGQKNPTGDERTAPTPAGSRYASQQDSGTEDTKDSEAVASAASKGMPYRNIDVLLKSDSRFVAGMKRKTEESSGASNALQTARSTGSAHHGQPRPSGRALVLLRLEPFTTWIRKLRRHNSGRPGI